MQRMLRLKAIRPHLYGTRRLEAGDEYEAPAEQAIAQVATRKADFAKGKPVEKVEAPLAPAPSVPRYEPEPEHHEPASLDELRLQATQLGINVDRRWGAHRLQHEIDEARQR